METILLRGSRMEPRLAVLKPASSAVSIGTGGPFGAEGPIIVTGGDYPPVIRAMGAVALFASMTNIVSGFLITNRMLKMFKEEKKIISLATIQSPLGSQFRITGLNGQGESSELALLLRAGGLAAPMYFAEERTIGPSLGADSIRSQVPCDDVTVTTFDPGATVARNVAMTIPSSFAPNVTEAVVTCPELVVDSPSVKSVNAIAMSRRQYVEPVRIASGVVAWCRQVACATIRHARRFGGVGRIRRVPPSN